MTAYGPLCVGIDPHGSLLDAWGLPRTLDGLREFADRCVAAFTGVVAAVKPQSAFFEVFGSAGIAVLEETTAALREASTLTILDVKRGDIGTTMEAYAQAFLADGSPGVVDAITVSPYLGYGSLRPVLDLAARTGRGAFVLCLTSNPEGAAVQHAVLGRSTVAAGIADGAAHDNAAARQRGELGSVGLVVGATVGSAVQDLGLDLAAVNGPLLAPGVGAQGGTAADLRRVFAGALDAVLPSSSREVLAAGPDVAALRDAAARHADRLARMLERAGG